MEKQTPPVSHWHHGHCCTRVNLNQYWTTSLPVKKSIYYWILVCFRKPRNCSVSCYHNVDSGYKSTVSSMYLIDCIWECNFFYPNKKAPKTQTIFPTLITPPALQRSCQWWAPFIQAKLLSPTAIWQPNRNKNSCSAEFAITFPVTHLPAQHELYNKTAAFDKLNVLNNFACQLTLLAHTDLILNRVSGVPLWKDMDMLTI